MLLTLLLASLARAERPTAGGLWSYESSDVVVFYDEPTGRVRVHYSESGPNQAAERDSDGSGVPDIVQDTGRIAAESLALFEELGFRPPVPESDFGLEILGGSPAFDFYLVDFGGGSDGSFGLDACLEVPRVCAGHMLVENDFAGSGYASVTLGLETVVPHELFHGIQAAYEAELPMWLSEGSATWAERRWDSGSNDYMRLCDGYLDDTQRPIYKAPGGPATSWAYGTGIWLDFLGSETGDEVWVIDLLSALERESADPVDVVPAMIQVMDDYGVELGPAWLKFSEWNLATEDRSGVAQSYDYAKRVGPVVAEGEGESVDDDQRFQPLATTYWRLDHPGGELSFAIETPTPELAFGLHPVDGGLDDGPVQDAVLSWRGETQSLGDFPAGGYWVWGAYDAYADASIKVRVCVGAPEVVAGCEAVDTGDTGDTGTPTDSEGCGGCGGGVPSGLAWVGGLLLWRRRQNSDHF